ncbi:LPS-assembly protein LptD [Allosphingosinicella flava]|uniref:LPS-assembly protein LptD n=1 Tax=Allosphingosinicella flava TaxID=2771430 RepID=A0A7T2GLW8_9SPHN|nr:LPS assembly protein LptD [Sphingosinicella flava]QPQ56217.1 LPS-assembly protein LptD [Sphingosinicella flava]
MAAQGQDATGTEEARQVRFSAAQLAYDTNTEIVTASGDVRMSSEGNNLRAEQVVWNRNTGAVQAVGNVRLVTPEGDRVYGDTVEVTDDLRDAVIDNLLLVLEEGGRLAANRATREDGIVTLYEAAYSPCAVLSENGCPKEPTWRITAVKVVYDPGRERIKYEDATLNLFGAPIIGLPGFSHPAGTGGGSGLLFPDIRIDRNNGFEIALPYYMKLAPNRDLTLTPHVYSEVLPMAEAEYRALTPSGAYRVRGFATYGSRTEIGHNVASEREKGFRAYIEGNGKFQIDPRWSITASGRYVTDPTFLRRYDISNDDRLRSLINAERIGENSYISIAGWAFQGLRATDAAGQQPFALPAIDARWRLADPYLGGRIEVQANSLAILRTEGQDTQRAFAGVRWDRRLITSWGQELTLTAYARGDLYHANDTALTQTPLYRGEEGWNGRAIAALAADLQWPLIGSLFGGTQRLTPRVQIIASPATGNLAIPNEDARAVDLEDSNLFALNRFPGYDRWEDGARITYGADWNLDLPGVQIRTTAGQSFRLDDRPNILPEGTGLSDKFSDYVGRSDVKIGRKISLVHRFRLDKDNLAVRRNEVDAIFGGRQTYATIGYLRLNRDIGPTLEDLRDREEVRAGGRVKIANYWSIFGSAVIDLTNADEDMLSSADGFEPVRHRLGIAYDDDCLSLGVTWRRDYAASGDISRGDSFLFRVALKNLGR